MPGFIYPHHRPTGGARAAGTAPLPYTTGKLSNTRYKVSKCQFPIPQPQQRGTNLTVRVHNIQGLPRTDTCSADDPYVIVRCGKDRHKTMVKKDTDSPMWLMDEGTFEYTIDDPATTTIHLWVYDKDTLVDDFLGGLQIVVQDLHLRIGKPVRVVGVLAHENMDTMEKVEKGKIEIGIQAWGPPFAKRAKRILRKRGAAPGKEEVRPPAVEHEDPSDGEVEDSEPVKLTGAAAQLLSDMLIKVATGETSMTCDEDIRHLFEVLDVDGNGVVSKKEFKVLYTLMEHCGVSMTERELDELLAKFDIWRDDVLTYDEFAVLVMQILKR